MPDEKRSEESFELEEKLYCLEAVQNAAYSFTDRAYVRVEPAGSGKLKVVMTLKAAGPEIGQALRGEFDNELLHQSLRLKVSDANRKIREFIVTKALVSAQPAELVGAAAPVAAPTAEACPDCAVAGAKAPEPASPPIDEALEKEIDRLLIEIEKGGDAADPLGVNVPWEEKFAPKKKGKTKVKRS